MILPQLTASRELIDLSGIWDFRLGSTELELDKLTAPLADAVPMAVPGSYNDQYEGKEWRDHYGYVYYQRSFELTPELALGQKRLLLRFGSVTHNCVVYLNGQEIARHKGGFLPFEVRLNGVAQVGVNTLAVAVDNRIDFSTLPVGNEQGTAMFGAELPDFPSVTNTKLTPRNYPNFDFFNYAGIHRPVSIYTTAPTYIDDLTLTSSVEFAADGVTASSATINYEVALAGADTANTPIEVTLLSETGEKLGSTSGSKGSFALTGEQVHLWQPGKAYLYRVVVTAGSDCYSEDYGVRTVEVKGTQFLINNQPFYFKGFGKHEDAAFSGKGLNETLNVADISLMKWLNANSFRTSHYPYAEEMMRLCDREGIVVIDETSAVGLNFPNIKEDWYRDLSRTKEHHEEVIRELIARDKNHACVVMWSIANEPDTATRAQSAYDYFMPLYHLAHECDPQNRPVTVVVVCNNNYTADLVAPAMDVICINRYYGWYIFGGDLDAAQQAMEVEMRYWQEKGKPVMLTEYGADCVPGLHQAVAGMFSEEYQCQYYDVINSVVEKYPCFVGEQCWNFADFNTIQGLYRVDGNKKGLLTRDRRPKMAAHYFKQRWQAIPDFGHKR